MSASAGERPLSDKPNLSSADPERLRQAVELLAIIRFKAAGAGAEIAYGQLAEQDYGIRPRSEPDWLIVPQYPGAREVGQHSIVLVRQPRGNWSEVGLGKGGNENCRRIGEVMTEVIEGQPEAVLAVSEALSFTTQE